MKRFSFVLSAALIGVLASCQGLKEALTAHVDVVARAGNQELTVNRLATWMSGGRGQPEKEFARIVARLWVDDQLIGLAAAHGDSLNQPAVIDSVLWGLEIQARIEKWLTMLNDKVTGDSAQYPVAYASGEALAARHILLAPKPGDTTKKTFDSLQKAAVSLRAKLTPTNFATMAKQYSKDPGSASKGGDLGVFKRGAMVPAFEQATLALKPGEISQPVKTQFGYHIIYRLTYAEAKPAFDMDMKKPLLMHADSLYFTHLDSAAKAHVVSNGGTAARAVVKDLTGHRDDKTVLATTSYGDFTAAEFDRWLSMFPPQVLGQIQGLPDSIMPKVITYLAHNPVMVHEMDSAHVTLDTAEIAKMHANYQSYVLDAWTNLNVDPKKLADSGKTVADRERIAAAHVDSFFDKIFSPTPTVRPFEVPQELDEVLHSKYSGDVNETGLDRAVAKATELHKQVDAAKKKADSARIAAEPPSAIPLPKATGPNPGLPKKP